MGNDRIKQKESDKDRRDRTGVRRAKQEKEEGIVR